VPRHLARGAASDADAVRQRILAAARRQFLSQGFRRVTMDELARELGMSKKTLYAQFASKRALLDAIVDQKFRGVATELAAITAEPAASFAGALRRVMLCLQHQLEEIKPPFMRDVQRECPDLFQTVEIRRRELIERHLGALLAKGRREGLVRKDVPLSLMMEILLAAVHAIANPPRLLELGLTPKQGMTAILSVVLEGALKPDRPSSARRDEAALIPHRSPRGSGQKRRAKP
jgi:AcrR family transcriptional regulator